MNWTDNAKNGLRGAGYALTFMIIGACWGIWHENQRMNNQDVLDAVCAARAAPITILEPQKHQVKKSKKRPPDLSDGIRIGDK